MEKKTWDEQIEAYIRGELSAKDITGFHQKAIDDPNFAKDVAFRCFQWQAKEMLIEEDLRAQMAHWKNKNDKLEDFVSPKKRPNSPLFHPFLSRHYVAAATIGLLILGAIAIWRIQSLLPISTNGQETSETLILPPKEKTLPHTENVSIEPNNGAQKISKNTQKIQKITKNDRNITPTHISIAQAAYMEHIPDFDVINRGENENILLNDVVQNYSQKNYDRVVALLQNTPITDENFAALEILAHVYFQSKQYSQALSLFQQLLMKSGKKSKEKLEWFVLICYLTDYSNHQIDFNQLSKKIIENSDHEYLLSAQKLSHQVQ